MLVNDAINAILKLQNASGAIAKKQVISDNKDNEHFQKLLFYALHPLLTYKVSERTLRKPMPYSASITLTMTNIFEVCEALAQRKALDDVTVYQVKGFLECQPDEYRELYTCIIAKTLRLGVTAKTVNKVIPGLIPEWEVQQAYPIEKYPIKDGTWFSLSQKLNGVRATYFRGHLYARSGEVYEGLDHIIDEIERFGECPVAFDGELTLLDKGKLSDNEAFREATGIINSEVGDKTRICFTIFDVIPADEFASGESSMCYKERRELLDELSLTMFKDAKYTHVLEVLYQGFDQSKIDELLDRMVREDKEGLMANLDVPYKCKRHNGILKVKRFYTMDLPIIRCEEGTGRLAGTLGAFVLNYKGNEVNVGTGFTDAERSIFWAARDKLTDLLCEVKYKEISYDKKTKAESLQFPVYVCLRTDKSEVSYG
jgi:DNA ligase-1